MKRYVSLLAAVWIFVWPVYEGKGRRTIQWGLLFLVGVLICPNLAICQDTTYMVKDIWPGPGGYLPTGPNALVGVNNTLYFFANDSLHGNELWKSDGTQAGTALVKDIRTGRDGVFFSYVVNFNGTLLFSIDNYPLHGDELWKSDGMDANTVPIKVINQNPSGIHSWPDFTTFGQMVLFVADDSLHGVELWKTDGTASGTVMVKDIYPGPSSGWPGSLTVCNGTLCFSADDGIHGEQLWRSDGTEAGTTMIKVIPASFPIHGSLPFYLTAAGGKLFFSAVDSIHGFELWKSDGTDSGTVLVKDIQPGVLNGLSDVMAGGEEPFFGVNGMLFFPASDGVHGFELWKSDGTEAGTVMVKDINPGWGSSLDATFYDWLEPQFAAMNNVLYFVADDGVHGPELWKSDGTEAGTFMVRDIYPGPRQDYPTGRYAYYPRNLTNCSGALYFSANDSVHGEELWKSDGTTAGTVLVADIYPGRSASSPSSLTNVGGKLFFAATDSLHGTELWVTIPKKATAVYDQPRALPCCFALEQNYPNPFNPETKIDFSIPRPEYVMLKVYDMLGREVATLVSDHLNAGTYEATWQASNAASGVYFYRLEAGRYSAMKKLLLLK
jgi:ELWxxDGT repeat protein